VGSFTPAQTQAMSAAFSQQIEDAIGVPQQRIYIEFADAKGYLWGWNGSTFG
jgi:phenylpyruvate tautomerase